jgi:hypothetical protein
MGAMSIFAAPDPLKTAPQCATVSDDGETKC